LRPLDEYVAEAKAQGKSEIDARVYNRERLSLAFPDDWLRASAVVVARPARLEAQQTVLPNNIVTWNVFKILRTLKTSWKPDPSGCHLWPRPPSLQLASDELAVPLEGGSAVIDGVTVRLLRTDPNTPFDLQGEYLLIAPTCLGHTLPIPGPNSSVYRILPDGQLMNKAPDDFELAYFVRSLGSVNAVQNYISRLPR
jgi:hypothetical protein